jgi:L-alanine-DL-glutamate epimerase-like enolase superfamily enzyme
LRASWQTAAGSFSEREGWLLRLDSDSGASGYGDCAPLPGGAAVTPAALRRGYVRRHAA